MKIRNRKSYLTTMPEGKAPKNYAKQGTKIIYLLILATVVCYLLWWLAGKFLYFEARGQVEVERHIVRATEEGVILALGVSPGTLVEEGDELMQLAPVATGGASPVSPLDGMRAGRDLALKRGKLMALSKRLRQLKDGNYNLIVLPEKVVALNQAIQLDSIRLEQLQARPPLTTVDTAPPTLRRDRLLELSRVPYQEKLRRQDKQREQELENSRQIAYLRRRIAAQDTLRLQLLAAEQKKVADTIANLKNEIAALEQFQQAVSANGGQSDHRGGGYTVRSPIAGKILALYRQQGETVTTGTPLLNMRGTGAKVVIHGYVNSRELDALRAKKQVNIRFADGSKDQGQIADFYSIAVPYREKITEGYTPIRTSILVEIAPRSQEQETRWRRYDRTDVTLRIAK